MSVTLPRSLYERIQSLATSRDSGSVSEYVISVLRKSLPVSGTATSQLTQQDEEAIRERLKALGYLD